MQRDETADLTIFNVNFQQGRMIELFIVCIDRSINIDVQYLHVKYYLIKLLMHKFTVLGSIFYHPLRSIIFNNIERACITPSGDRITYIVQLFIVNYKRCCHIAPCRPTRQHAARGA